MKRIGSVRFYRFLLGAGMMAMSCSALAQDATTTSLTSALNPSIYGQQVTFTAQVTTSGAHSPTGTVDFTSSIAGALGSATLSGRTVTQIASGNYHTCAVLSDSTAACWGRNDYGQLGIGTSGAAQSLPVMVRNMNGTADLTGVRAITAGSEYTCALLTDGSVACWGGNQYGRLGRGAGTQQSLPVRVRSTDGTADLANVESIDAGAFHACAGLTGGTAVCWGLNDWGQLGDGTSGAGNTSPLPVQVIGTAGGTLTGVQNIAAGEYHTCALLRVGNIACWGYNSNGQIGDDTTPGPVTFRPQPGLVLDAFGTAPLQGARAVAVGAYHSCAWWFNGNTRCWGQNLAGQLGNGTTMDSSRPVSVQDSDNISWLGAESMTANGNHTCAILRDGSMVCTGENYAGQLGNGQSGQNRSLPVAVRNPANTGSLTDVQSIAQGLQQTCAVLTNGTATCWGDNTSGQLGTGDQINRSLPTPVSIPTASTASLTTTTAQLAGGAHSITASYGGDADNAASDNTAAPLSQVVDAAATTASLASSATTVRYGTPVTLTATVSVQDPVTSPVVPVGQVIFRAGVDVPLPNTSLDGSGVASVTTSAIPVGARTILADFLASDYRNFDSDFGSAHTSVTVLKAVTATALTSVTPASATYGQNVTLSAQVSVTDGGGTPGGLVEFHVGAMTVSAFPNGAGVATASVTVPTGSYSVTASYVEDASFLGSESTALPLVVSPGTSTVTLSSAPGPIAAAGQSLTLTATVGGPSPLPGVAPSGTAAYASTPWPAPPITSRWMARAARPEPIC